MKKEDIEQASEMILRLKKLNGEFDPLFEVSNDAPKDIREMLDSSMNQGEKCLMVVAEIDKKVVGVIRVNFNSRLYYLPKNEARIMDFYVMPEFRRTGAGKYMLDFVGEEFSRRKVGLISAEFPALNPIANSFYKKLGFKEIVGIYAKRVEEEK
jgi:ribosomal protein S18 acetylase RimI-like enzyme